MQVFTYGTLKKGGMFHHVLGKSQFIGKAKIRGTMYNLGPYPAVVLKGNTDIHGEVYEVDGPILADLDYLEGYPGFYDRELIHTSLGDAFVYFHQYDTRLTDTPDRKSVV